MSPIAPWIGLALPRILRRLPDGGNSNPISAFDSRKWQRALQGAWAGA